jgi:hypothetical protein
MTSRDDAERIARNEATFRRINESVSSDRHRRSGNGVGLISFMCECAALDCREAVQMTASEYEDLRAAPRRFAVVDGHEKPELERVVWRGERYAVIEKTGEGGQVAEDLDPRS